MPQNALNLLFIDNYDSFTYNIVELCDRVGILPHVVRHDRITLEEVENISPKKILLGPGPGTPHDAGISLSLIHRFAEKIPILGICLGHQCLGVAFGGKVKKALRPQHGITSLIYPSARSPLFNEVSFPFHAMRYNSLVVDKESLPDELEVTAFTEEGEIMALQHRTLPLFGVQFHPEAILSEYGEQIMANFIKVK